MNIIERSPTRLHIRSRNLSLWTFHHVLRKINGDRWLWAFGGVYLLIAQFTGRLLPLDVSNISNFTTVVLAGIAGYSVWSLADLIRDFWRVGSLDLSLNVDNPRGPTGVIGLSGAKRTTVRSAAKGVHWNCEKFDAHGNAAMGAEVTEVTRYNKTLYQVWLQRNYGNLLIVDGFPLEEQAREMEQVINDWCKEAWAKIDAKDVAEETQTQASETTDGDMEPAPA